MPAKSRAKAKPKKTLGRRDKGAQPEPPRAKAGPQPSRDWDELADKASKKLEEAGEEAKRIALDLSEGVDKAFVRLRTEAEHVVKKGQHTRVRIKFRGKQIAELPVAVVAAAEIASLWWAGPLRLLLAHVVGKAVLEVEFVSDAQSHVAAGRALLSSGDLDDALKEFDRALEMDSRNAAAHLGRGVAFKLRGDKEAARRAFVLAEEYDPRGESGREARRHLDNLGQA